MPELTEVETPKNAGFVQTKANRSANKKRIEKDEAELKALIEGNTEESNEEETAKAKEANTEAEEATLSPEERTYKKRYSDLRKHLNKQTEEIKELKAKMENTVKGDLRPPSSDESIEAWANKYPEIASIVETIATKKADEKFATADQRLQEIDKLNAETHRTKAESEIRKLTLTLMSYVTVMTFILGQENNLSGYRMPCTKTKMTQGLLYVLLIYSRLIMVWTSSLRKRQLKTLHLKSRQKETLGLTMQE